MYSPNVVDRSQHSLEKKLGLKLHRYSPADSLTVSDSLQKLIKKGKLTRGLTPAERQFVQNEILLCTIDFRYAMRYYNIELDGAVGIGVGPAELWESQTLTMDLIGKIEEENYELRDAGDPCTGVCICQHKSRQLGCTALARLMSGHRRDFWKHTRAMAASLDDSKVHEQLYKRDKLGYDNLPWFLKSPIKFDVKDGHFELQNGSYTMYQKSSQETGLGQGSQFDVSHITEVASWPNPRVIELDFIPAIPQSPYVFCILESTAQGRGDWWHDFTEKVRKGKVWRWHYVFWPWYVNKSKYRAKAPDEWRPAKFTLNHAKMVAATSHKFVGHSVELTRSQLYWYEMNYMNAREKGELHLFLLNYAATPEESFQHSGISAFDTEFLNELRTETATRPVRSYDFLREAH